MITGDKRCANRSAGRARWWEQPTSNISVKMGSSLVIFFITVRNLVVLKLSSELVATATKKSRILL